MKDIIKSALIGYVRALLVLLIFISGVATIQSKCVLDILGCALFIFISTEVVYYIITKVIKLVLKVKSNHDNNR